MLFDLGTREGRLSHLYREKRREVITYLRDGNISIDTAKSLLKENIQLDSNGTGPENPAWRAYLGRQFDSYFSETFKEMGISMTDVNDKGVIVRTPVGEKYVRYDDTKNSAD